MPPPILAHIHLRKCAGTAFAQLLERHFGPRHVRLYADDIYFSYRVEELERVLRETPDVAAFSSHHVRTFPATLVGRPVLYVTFLRDPLRQFVSYMTHVRKHYAELTHPSLVRSLPPDAAGRSLREFASWLLTSEQDVFFRENYDLDFFTRYNPGPGGQLTRAKAILKEFFFVGITERMDESMRTLRRLADARGLDFPGEPLHVVNASSAASDDLHWIHPEDEVGAMLLDSVCEDRQLYQWVLHRQAGCLTGDAHPIRTVIESIRRENIPGGFRAAGIDPAEAATVLGGLGPAGGGGQIALLWLAGDADGLRHEYPQVSTGGYVVVDQYRADGRCRVTVDNYRAEWDIREPLIPIGSAGVYWRVGEAVPGWQPPSADLFPEEPAMQALLQVYAARQDLQQAFPEAGAWDFKRLIHWASQAARGDFTDSSAHLLQTYSEWYALNDPDFTENPLPEALRGQRVQPHWMTLALLIAECGLREVVEVRDGAGSSTRVLEHAAQHVGGRVRSVQPGSTELSGPIDLLFIDSLPLYSPILAQLRAFAPLLQEGSWIALSHTVISPGVTKALLESIESFGWKPRLYPFLHGGGLILARIFR